MNKSNQFHSNEPLWSVPQSIMDRLSSKEEHSDTKQFFLAGLFSLVGLCGLLFFGFAALLRGEMDLAYVLFGFSVLTIGSYLLIWITGYLFLAKHWMATILALICLYLFYSGGSQGTGPMYYFIFPLFAVFLQGYRLGSISVTALLIASLFIYNIKPFGFDENLYEYHFVSRVIAIYVIISLLAIAFSYIRHLAEHELLLSYGDIEQITFADTTTGIANRNLMEKLLTTESNRHLRYKSKFCIMLLSIDNFDAIRNKSGTGFADFVLAEFAQILNRTLRVQDIPSRWEREEFLVLLPETSLKSSNFIRKRLIESIENHSFNFQGQQENITVSHGTSQMEGTSLSDLIRKAEQIIYRSRQDKFT